jgi:hypothetical protein
MPGPKPLGVRAMTAAERQARFRAAHADGTKVRYRRPGDRDAVAELVELQEGYRAWLDSLPDNLADPPPSFSSIMARPRALAARSRNSSARSC